MEEGFTNILENEKELEDVLEGDEEGGVAEVPPRPSSTTPSCGSSGSRSATKRRTWKKPKDKPKRPLSAYNIFFKHERSRIVEGKIEEPTADEVIHSIENILATARETRRHRKTHGRISFGDLARQIADKWKAIGSEQKAVFEHYAELDMRRYRKELKAWKDKKENEALSGQKQASLSDSMNNSFSSQDSIDSEFSLDHLPSNSSGDAWAPRKNFYDSMNSSFSSQGSLDSEFSLEPIPIGRMIRNPQNNMHASLPNIGMNDGHAYGQAFGSIANLQQNEQPYMFGQQSFSALQPTQFMNQMVPDQSFSGFRNDQRFQQNLDPVPFEQVFPNAAHSGGSGSQDLEDFLSNLDLSNV